ncbi:hypothetical protein JX265_005134 [Neoarthrinium moseri]|uniref:Chromatin modification-related protein EAF3 n=1 Tax=Neoarthrinium moseri TaxID=1658444 RepID=A0A9P9WP84_9PEZI|nr:hypothetical protein JX265_005134 [Neoarthrinium moseri]
MAPSKQAPGPIYAKDEKVLCFHGDLMYEAKITDIRSAADPANTNVATIKADDAQYKVHYKGWKSSWDDWVLQDRIRKFTDDNKALATQLQQAARLRTAGGSKSAKKAIGKAVGGGDSEMSSARGSEERAAMNSYAGRGPRRGRDYELESGLPDAAHHLILNKFTKKPPRYLIYVEQRSGHSGTQVEHRCRSGHQNPTTTLSVLTFDRLPNFPHRTSGL